uniref:Pectate lyase domain-containing protein n=1 Tax=Streptomyces avermitilis TaxID=33903 RepID=A0A499VJI9_STRAX|nr:hypothetical protein SAVMC3_72420 [Streptomyces avermitilis]
MNAQTWHGHVTTTVLVGCTALALAVTGTTATATAQAQAQPRDLGRQTLAAGDGWASDGTGTTGGAAADAAHVYTVTTWAGFKAALKDGGTAPKIIKVKGTIDANAEGCDSFAAAGYDFDAYLRKYSPENWGYGANLDAEPDDSPEGLRRVSADTQAKAIKASVPANTTIVGLGKNAGFEGASLQITAVDNVIIRNVAFESPSTASRSGTRPTPPSATGTPSTTARWSTGPRTSGWTTTRSPTGSTPTARCPPTSGGSTSSTTASWTSSRARTT